jgi:hypothetical protein
MRMAASTQCGIASVALVIVLSGNTRPMIDGVAQSNMRSVTHDHNMGFAAAFGHGGDTR